MATRPSKTKPVSLQVVISELQFILDLHDESKNDPRLRDLVIAAKEDFRLAIKKFPGGDDQSKQKVPDDEN